MSVRNAPYGAQNGVSTVGAALSGATIGVKLSYVCPAGKQAVVRWSSVSNFTGAPTVAMQAIVGGVTVTLQSQAAQGAITPTLTLNAGDTFQLNVTALVAASVFDGAIVAEEYGAT